MRVIKAIQKIYPDIKGGFVYWETKYNGEPLDNPIDGLKWENTEYQKPTWEQIEAHFPEVEIEIKREKLKSVRLKYLAETAIRYMPNFPQDVIIKRDLANQEINAIETATDLSNYSEEF